MQIGSARLFIRLREAAAKQLAEALWDKDLGLGPVREQLEGKKYKVITTINRGGMGVILQARDLRIRRTVAMKVMKTSSQFSRENVLRFIDEAQLTGQLEHPNIVPVYELGIDEQGEMFLHDEVRQGHTLDDVLRGIRNGTPEDDREVSARHAADHLPEGLRRRGLRPLEGRGPSRSQAGEHHDRRVRRGAGHGLGAGEEHHRRAARDARRGTRRRPRR